MTEEKRIQLTADELKELSAENLFTLLVDLQNSTANLFAEAWRRGIHTELAEKAMQLKARRYGQ